MTNQRCCGRPKYSCTCNKVRTKPTKRYFIVFYDGANNIGSISITTDEGYLDIKSTSKIIAKRVGGTNIVAITNIIELNESDYKDWVK